VHVHYVHPHQQGGVACDAHQAALVGHVEVPRATDTTDTTGTGTGRGAQPRQKGLVLLRAEELELKLKLVPQLELVANQTLLEKD
jgi:hypothetical protein